MNGESIEIIKAYIKKSNSKFASAKISYDNKFYDDACSRAYYAVFHLLSAVLFSKNLTFSSHKEVIGNFNKEFIKTGIFPIDYYKKIRLLFDNRESGDYEIKKYIDEPTASICLNYAGEIINKCKEYLSGLYNVSIDYWLE